jgi:hypothetical protein
MRYLVLPSLLSASVFLSGCGDKVPKLNSTLPSTTQQSTEPPAPRVLGDWEFNTTSNVVGNLALRFAGSIDSQTDPSKGTTDFKGTLHIDGSNCFDRSTTVGFTGTATADDGSVTITASGGQMVTFTGSFSNVGFTATYSINGGCANGNQGKVNGSSIFDINDDWEGVFTSSAHNPFNVVVDIAQNGSSTSEGVFGLTGMSPRIRRV